MTKASQFSGSVDCHLKPKICQWVPNAKSWQERKRNYKNDVDVIVCGATRLVGKQLVPALSVDLNVAVMGRDKKSLSTLFQTISA